MSVGAHRCAQQQMSGCSFQGCLFVDGGDTSSLLDREILQFRYGFLKYAYSSIGSIEEFQVRFGAMVERNGFGGVRFYGCVERHSRFSDYYVLVDFGEVLSLHDDCSREAFSLGADFCQRPVFRPFIRGGGPATKDVEESMRYCGHLSLRSGEACFGQPSLIFDFYFCVISVLGEEEV